MKTLAATVVRIALTTAALVTIVAGHADAAEQPRPGPMLQLSDPPTGVQAGANVELVNAAPAVTDSDSRGQYRGGETDAMEAEVGGDWCSLSDTSSAEAPAERIVSDYLLGFTVHLRNCNGFTVVTNVESGEAITIQGEWADLITDDMYSDMMQKKYLPMSSATTTAIEIADALGDISSPLSGSLRNDRFSLYCTSVEEPSPTGVYVNSTSVTVSVTSECPACNSTDTVLNGTLYQYVAFWPDPSKGTKSFKTKGTVTRTWSSLTRDKSYYLIFTKRCSPTAWAYGSYTMTW